jgi:hypothetical protein
MAQQDQLSIRGEVRSWLKSLNAGVKDVCVRRTIGPAARQSCTCSQSDSHRSIPFSIRFKSTCCTWTRSADTFGGPRSSSVWIGTPTPAGIVDQPLDHRVAQGWVWADPNANGGATFSFTLPAAAG